MHQIAKEDSNENHRHHATWKLAHQVKHAWNHVCWTLTKHSVGRSNESSSIAKPKLYLDSYVGEKIIQKIGTFPLATAVFLPQNGLKTLRSGPFNAGESSQSWPYRIPAKAGHNYMVQHGVLKLNNHQLASPNCLLKDRQHSRWDQDFSTISPRRSVADFVKKKSEGLQCEWSSHVSNVQSNPRFLASNDPWVYYHIFSVYIDNMYLLASSQWPFKILEVDALSFPHSPKAAKRSNQPAH